MGKRNSKGQFAAGTSGNPAGRPTSIAEVVELAREHTVEALATIVALMQAKTTPASTRLRAAEALLARAWGEPAKPLTVAGDDEGGVEIVFVAKKPAPKEP